MIIPVILCGGAGVRLWPASREDMPKPFLPLVDGASTFALTLRRIAIPEVFGPALVVANAEHVALVREQSAETDVVAAILTEPDGRDTAGAIAAAAAFLAGVDERAVMLVLPADHLIRDDAGFVDTVLEALQAAEEGHIVVFGVRPDHPATGFGYIDPGEPLFGTAPRAVAAFVEKPDRARASALIENGCLWNSGMFMMKATVAVEELAALAPEIMSGAAAAVSESIAEDAVVRLGVDNFLAVPRKSFDYAVMEKTRRAAVVEARFDWSDLGTWSAVWQASTRDAAGNVAAGDVTLVDTENALVASDAQQVGVLGLRDIVVVAGNGSVLVTSRARAGEVKELVSAIEARPEKVIGDFVRHYRPWGYYQALDVGERHQVKRIVVNPGARLSLQKHSHRSEHWTVVSGVAETTIGMTMDSLETKTVAEKGSAFVPLGAIHRLANPGTEPVTLIEVQVGEYLGEDDIVRLQDDYGR